MLVILIALSLSMDAFSMSLAYGMIGLNKLNIITLAIIVGLYHFFMPLIGMVTGNFVVSVLKIEPNIIAFIVLVFIGINMIIDSFKNNDAKFLTFVEMFLFALAVSIDSFSVGISFKAITNNEIISSLIFMITSFLFTIIGLNLGKKINKVIGKSSTILGGIILIIIGIIYL